MGKQQAAFTVHILHVARPSEDNRAIALIFHRSIHSSGHLVNSTTPRRSVSSLPQRIRCVSASRLEEGCGLHGRIFFTLLGVALLVLTHHLNKQRRERSAQPCKRRAENG
jgi:hypothetical protein